MAEAGANKKIFFVEDDDEVAEMLCAYFGDQGYDVTHTAWGEEAVALISEQIPDVVVLDIHLPDIDGYEVCRRLRRARRTSHLPVIFLTERNEREDRLAGLELGAVDYINKPFDIQELHLRARNVLDLGKLRSSHNSLTGLPEASLVRTQLKAMLTQPDWGLVLVQIRGLDRFRERYGFVAADDVMRAVSLMLAGVSEEDGGAPFLGHAGEARFVLITSAARCRYLLHRCRVRLDPSLPYFYPAADQHRLETLPPQDRLSFKLACHIAAEHASTSLDELATALDLPFGD